MYSIHSIYNRIYSLRYIHVVFKVYIVCTSYTYKYIVCVVYVVYTVSILYILYTVCLIYIVCTNLKYV